MKYNMADLQQRTTSAGYRLPLGNTTSVYRDLSRPDGGKAGGNRKAREIERIDEVSWNKIWREQIQNEWKGLHDW